MAWNQHLFLLMNGPAHPAAWLLLVAQGIAASPVVLAPGVLILLWIWGDVEQRGALLATAGGMVLGQGLNQALGALWFEPRPFVVGLGHLLGSHVADNSFPSDHATLVWCLGFGLILTGAARRTGVAVCLFGLPVAWARVYLGFHFPIDVAASLPVALVASGTAWLALPVVDRWLLPVADLAYDGTLQRLHLPPRLFPRHLGQERAGFRQVP